MVKGETYKESKHGTELEKSRSYKPVAEKGAAQSIDRSVDWLTGRLYIERPQRITTIQK